MDAVRYHDEPPAVPAVGEGTSTSTGVPASRVRHLALLVLLIMVSIAVPILLSIATGSLSIPHNDDWSYSKIAQHFAARGHVALMGWNRAAIVGHAIVLGSFGFNAVTDTDFAQFTNDRKINAMLDAETALVIL